MTKSIEALSTDVMINGVLPYLANGFSELINFGRVNKQCWDLLEQVPLQGAWSMAASAAGYNFKLEDYEYAYQELSTLNANPTARMVVEHACYQKSVIYKSKFKQIGEHLAPKLLKCPDYIDSFTKQIALLAEARTDKRFLTNITLYNFLNTEQLLKALKDCPNIRNLTLKNFRGEELTLTYNNLRSLTLIEAPLLKRLNLNQECLNLKKLKFTGINYPVRIATFDNYPIEIELSLVLNKQVEFSANLANRPCLLKVGKLSINKISINNLVILLKLFPNIKHLEIRTLNLDGLQGVTNPQMQFSLSELISLVIKLDHSTHPAAARQFQHCLFDLRKCPKLVNFQLSYTKHTLAPKIIVVSNPELSQIQQKSLVNTRPKEQSFWYTDFSLAKHYAYKNSAMSCWEFVALKVAFTSLCGGGFYIYKTTTRNLPFNALMLTLALIHILIGIGCLYAPFRPGSYNNIYLPAGYRGLANLPLEVRY